MTRKKLKAALNMMMVVANADRDEETLHEIAHSVLLFGRVRFDARDHVSRRIDRMTPAAANRHEMRTMALQLAVTRKLGLPRPKHALRDSFSNLESYSWFINGGTDRSYRSYLYPTYPSFVAAVNAERPSKRNIERVMSAIRALERFV